MSDPTEARWTPSGHPRDELEITASGATHPGLLRAHNEDAWFVGPPVFLVADGMGGHEAGDVASRLVVEAFEPFAGSDVATVADVESALNRSRAAIGQLATSPASAPGSTLIAATYVLEGGRSYWLVTNIGDSRAYLLSPRGLEQLSRDHSIVQELIEAGEIDVDEARHHPERHVITRAIGALEDSPAEYALVPIESGHRLLLCSDGLTGELTDRAIEAILRDTGSTKAAATRLVAAAVDAGGHDNVTVVVIDAVAAGESRVSSDTFRQVAFETFDADTVPTGRRAS